jgi:hypothetical protein
VLSVGDLLPHFRVNDLEGQPFEYATRVWQRRNLLLVRFPSAASTAETTYLSALDGCANALRACETDALVTRDSIEGMPGCGIVVADRWGEVFAVHRADDVATLPAPAGLIEWADYVQRQCPECRGETR